MFRHAAQEARDNPGLVIMAGVGASKGVYEVFIKDQITARRTWGLIGAAVVLHELLCGEGELLSEGADRAIERHPMLVPFMTLAVAGHVANLIPENLDIIHNSLKMLKRN